MNLMMLSAIRYHYFWRLWYMIQKEIRVLMVEPGKHPRVTVERLSLFCQSSLGESTIAPLFSKKTGKQGSFSCLESFLSVYNHYHRFQSARPVKVKRVFLC